MSRGSKYRRRPCSCGFGDFSAQLHVSSMIDLVFQFRFRAWRAGLFAFHTRGCKIISQSGSEKWLHLRGRLFQASFNKNGSPAAFLEQTTEGLVSYQSCKK